MPSLSSCMWRYSVPGSHDAAEIVLSRDDAVSTKLCATSRSVYHRSEQMSMSRRSLGRLVSTLFGVAMMKSMFDGPVASSFNAFCGTYGADKYSRITRRESRVCGSIPTSLSRSPLQRRVGPRDPLLDSEENTDASRIEQIQDAIRRGEERALMHEGDGPIVDAEVVAPRRLTPEQDRALKSMFVQPVEEETIDIEAIFAAKAREYRINRTLEFCPDGVLARQILGEMCSNGTKPDVQSWNQVMEAFGVRGALDEALAVFKEMQEARIAANGATYDVLARPSMKRGEFRFVERLYTTKAADNGGGIGAASLSILLDAYGNGHPPEPDKAKQAFRSEMDFSKELGIPVAVAADAFVIRSLRNAIGLNQTCEICWEYGLDPGQMLYDQ